MKKILIMALLISINTCFAQRGGEWFRQNKTQKKYLLAQIAALKVYIDAAQKGYKIAKEGLSTIGKLSKGEFDLHGVYFNSLKKVNPEIRQYAKIGEIITLEVKTVQNYHKVFDALTSTGSFSRQELEYIERVFARLLDECEQTLNEVISVTTDNQLEMKDDERIERINGLYLEMQHNYVFCKGFGNNAMVMAVARKKEKDEAITGRVLHGIQNQQP